ncbi:gamma-glutamyltransferase [Cyclobacterium salsum]|uniref:gamma-glutamyltransferase n=1 Tax=Cyclobacterium salsum TaxID=2666329 RepID=UPI001390C20A|nr:gamma-glutamyltransferase [Cyclobacterium salsum]
MMTTALMQIALNAGARVSYFGVMEFVYFEAETGTVHTMDADWNTVMGELDPLSIPGGPPMNPDGLLPDHKPSGRTALVGGFMKGVGAAHERFGSLPFGELFKPAIHVAAEGFPVDRRLAGIFSMRSDDLGRLPETRETLLKENGQPYTEGEIFRQPALAHTLSEFAVQGTDYMYRGPLAERLITAIREEGGKMTLEDLEAYEVIWDESLVSTLGGYEVHVMPPPMRGGTLLIEAQNLAEVSGLINAPHWSESGESLRKALTIAEMFILDFMPEEAVEELYPGLNRTDSARTSPEFARELWSRMESGILPFSWSVQAPKYSDVVITADEEGNMVAISHSINTVYWGKTAIVVDGISVSDPGSFQQAGIAKAGPGKRLPGPAQVGLLLKNGQAVLGFGSMGGGMHHRPFQALLNFVHFGMTVDEAIAAPDFFVSGREPETNQLIVHVPEGRFPKEVLQATGFQHREIPLSNAEVKGSGVWVGISRDPETGELKAASDLRSNSAAVAY